MKNILFAALCITVLFMPVHAQDVNKAKEILAKVSAKYKKFATIKVDLKYILEIQGDKKFKEQQSGTLYLKKPKFKFNPFQGCASMISSPEGLNVNNPGLNLN